jgi:hypothetical protein
VKAPLFPLRRVSKTPFVLRGLLYYREWYKMKPWWPLSYRTTALICVAECVTHAVLYYH